VISGVGHDMNLQYNGRALVFPLIVDWLRRHISDRAPPQVPRLELGSGIRQFEEGPPRAASPLIYSAHYVPGHTAR
jgi:hypothetical protein